MGMGIKRLDPMEITEDLNSDRELLIKRLTEESEPLHAIDTEMSEPPTHSPANEKKENSFAERFESFLANQALKRSKVKHSKQDQLILKALKSYQHLDEFELNASTKGQSFKKVA